MTKTTEISLSTFLAPTADLDMGSQKLTAVADPSTDQDAATKKYVDDAVTRTATTKSSAATLTDAEVLGGLVLLTAAVELTLPAADTGNDGADLFVSASAAGTLKCTAGFHGGGASVDTVTFAAYEGCHVYSDGADWYLLGAGPGCTLS